jgi:hypothetical protein
MMARTLPHLGRWPGKQYEEGRRLGSVESGEMERLKTAFLVALVAVLLGIVWHAGSTAPARARIAEP